MAILTYKGYTGVLEVDLEAGELFGRALGMRIAAVTRSPEKKRPHAHLFDEIHGVSQLRRLLPLADAVVMTVPDTDETINMLDRSGIAAMRPGAAFVNIGRGNTVDLGRSALARSNWRRRRHDLQSTEQVAWEWSPDGCRPRTRVCS